MSGNSKRFNPSEDGRRCLTVGRECIQVEVAGSIPGCCNHEVSVFKGLATIPPISLPRLRHALDLGVRKAKPDSLLQCFGLWLPDGTTVDNMPANVLPRKNVVIQQRQTPNTRLHQLNGKLSADGPTPRNNDMARSQWHSLSASSSFVQERPIDGGHAQVREPPRHQP